MKKSAVLFVVSTLVISACSKSDGGGSGTPAIGINPYGTGVGQSANPASFGFWQMDRVQNISADGTGLVHLNSGRVMSESFSIDQANVEIVGFPDDLVRPYRGGYQLNGQTLILNGNNGNNQFPYNPNLQNGFQNQNGYQNPVGFQNQMGVPNQIQGQYPIQQNPQNPNQPGFFNPAENLVMTLVNANELVIGSRHFHRVPQNQFQMFRSQVSQIAMQFGGSGVNGQNGRGPIEPPYQLPENHKAERKNDEVTRHFPQCSNAGGLDGSHGRDSRIWF